MTVTRLRTTLDAHGVEYYTYSHDPAYSALELAEAAHLRGRYVAKSVMVKLDGRMVMAVVPADHRVDLEALAAISGSRRAELAGEAEFARLFVGCEAGAMPPFGNMWCVPVWVSVVLAEDRQIAFPAGNHREIMVMSFADYQWLVQPRIAAISTHL